MYSTNKLWGIYNAEPKNYNVQGVLNSIVDSLSFFLSSYSLKLDFSTFKQTAIAEKSEALIEIERFDQMIKFFF